MTANTARPTRYRRDLRDCEAPTPPPRPSTAGVRLPSRDVPMSWSSMARIWACADILSARGPARPGRVTPTAAYKARGAAAARPCPSRPGRGRSPAVAGGWGRERALPPPGFPGGTRSGKLVSQRSRCRRLAPPRAPSLPLPPAPATRARRRERKPVRTRPARLRPLRDVSADGPRRSPIGPSARAAHWPTGLRRSAGDAPRGEAPDWAAGLGPWGVLIGQEGPRGRRDVTISRPAAAPGGAGSRGRWERGLGEVRLGTAPL